MSKEQLNNIEQEKSNNQLNETLESFVSPESIIATTVQTLSGPLAVPFFNATAQFANGSPLNKAIKNIKDKPFAGLYNLTQRLGGSAVSRMPIGVTALTFLHRNEKQSNPKHVATSALIAGGCESLATAKVEYNEISHYLKTTKSKMPKTFAFNVLFRNSITAIPVLNGISKTMYDKEVIENVPEDKPQERSAINNILSSTKNGFIAGASTNILQAFVVRSTTEESFAKLTKMTVKDFTKLENAEKFLLGCISRGGAIATVTFLVVSSVEAYKKAQNNEASLSR